MRYHGLNSTLISEFNVTSLSLDEPQILASDQRSSTVAQLQSRNFPGPVGDFDCYNWYSEGLIPLDAKCEKAMVVIRGISHGHLIEIGNVRSRRRPGRYIVPYKTNSEYPDISFVVNIPDQAHNNRCQIEFSNTALYDKGESVIVDLEYMEYLLWGLWHACPTGGHFKMATNRRLGLRGSQTTTTVTMQIKHPYYRIDHPDGSHV